MKIKQPKLIEELREFIDETSNKFIAEEGSQTSKEIEDTEHFYTEIYKLERDCFNLNMHLYKTNKVIIDDSSHEILMFKYSKTYKKLTVTHYTKFLSSRNHHDGSSEIKYIPRITKLCVIKEDKKAYVFSGDNVMKLSYNTRVNSLNNFQSHASRKLYFHLNPDYEYITGINDKYNSSYIPEKIIKAATSEIELRKNLIQDEFEEVFNTLTLIDLETKFSKKSRSKLIKMYKRDLFKKNISINKDSTINDILMLYYQCRYPKRSSSERRSMVQFHRMLSDNHKRKIDLDMSNKEVVSENTRLKIKKNIQYNNKNFKRYKSVKYKFRGKKRMLKKLFKPNFKFELQALDDEFKLRDFANECEKSLVSFFSYKDRSKSVYYKVYYKCCSYLLSLSFDSYNEKPVSFSLTQVDNRIGHGNANELKELIIEYSGIEIGHTDLPF